MKVPPGTPAMPDYLDPVARAEWHRVVPILVKAGVLTEADGTMVAAYCTAHSLYVRATDAYNEQGLMLKERGAKMAHVNPMVKVAAAARDQAMKLAAEFGLSPSSRTRVSGAIAPAPKADDGDDSSRFLFETNGTLKRGDA